MHKKTTISAKSVINNIKKRGDSTIILPPFTMKFKFKNLLTPHGRGDKIRTCDPYVPNVVLYQTEPHLVQFGIIPY